MFFFTAIMIANAVTAHPARDTPIINPHDSAVQCPETPMSLARKMGERSTRALPLGELPPGVAFMAVDRRVDGCPAPLTASEYRRTR